ncbi:FadR/GntR family transcriptional regulator [Uliginosibacterium sp. sgz301328]|uniref:FadR/GntR family transcriptional regulator n=1 Tax=Uliginosibacterium sp. sgz301328 TaxID=3243764 RepID=UPI00359EF90E
MVTKRITKTDRIIEAFGRAIVHGDYPPGTTLPSESDLCTQFETSRNVLREVIKVLATKRLIDAQRFRGLSVMPREQWNYLDADVLEWALEKGNDPVLIHSLIEVRSMLEPVISRWAAERATAVDLVAIESALNDMKRHADDRPAFMEADIAFHRAITIATHNLVIQQMSDAVSALQRAIFDHTFLMDKAHLALTIKEHSDLFDFIRYKNVEAAEKISIDMITRTASRAKVQIENGEILAS